MLKYVVVITIAFCINSCVVIPTYTSEISLATIEHDSSTVKMKRLLLAGAGTIPTRVFLENLSGRMQKELSKKDMSIDFAFMNKLSEPFRMQEATTAASSYDACLVFRSTNETFLDLNNKKYIAAGPGAYGEKIGTQYVEHFTATLYRNDATFTPIWRGKLKVDFDMVNDSKYQRISNLLYKEWLKKKVLIP